MPYRSAALLTPVCPFTLLYPAPYFTLIHAFHLKVWLVQIFGGRDGPEEGRDEGDNEREGRG